MTTLVALAIGYALTCLIVAMLFCTVRLLAGPSAQDRVLALDALWMCCMLVTLLLGMRFRSTVYFDAALLIAVVGFASTIALAKFLNRGEIIE
jgi:multicomponent K+:H+ antiporter subunit F